MKRRELLKAIGYSSVLLSTGVHHMSFGAPVNSPLIVVFLRGGADSLQMAAPIDDPHYISARPANLRILDYGPNKGIQIAKAFAPQRDCRLHHSCAPLTELFQSGHAQILHACGLKNATRSHFEAQEMLESNLTSVNGKNNAYADGWLAPFLLSTVNKTNQIQSVGTSVGQIRSLKGVKSTLGLSGELRTGIGFPDDSNGKLALEALYSNNTSNDPIFQIGRAAIEQMNLLEKKVDRKDGRINPYTPPKNIEYNAENNNWLHATQTVAQLIKMDIGLKVACINLGGWDTHENQAGRINSSIRQWAGNIKALIEDLQASNQHATIVVMSEFGRRLRANASGGTDHGHANALWLFDTKKRGLLPSTIWPGLASENLDQGLDLKRTSEVKKTLSMIAKQSLT